MQVNNYGPVGSQENGPGAKVNNSNKNPDPKLTPRPKGGKR